MNKFYRKYHHPAAVLSCCFGENSNSVLSGGLDKTVRSYDVESKVENRFTLAPNDTFDEK